jgi:predicted metal-dependent phosphotriesterase family hydrolase
MTERDYDWGLDPGESFEPDELPDDITTEQPHVMTALGPIAPGALGLTLHHEHVIAKPMDVGAADPDLLLDSVDAAVAELEDAFFLGLRGIVDMTPADYGRDPEAILWVAQRVPVHVIVVTGHHKHLHAAPWVRDQTISEIAARNIMEIRDGIDGTSVRAGVIKAGTSLNAITDVEERVLRAAAQAHRATGAPISTHTDKGTMALEQIAILREEGVDPGRVVIGHLDFALDEDYLLRVLDTGAFVSFDQVSKTKYASDEERAAMLAKLAAKGHLNQLLISGDLARKSYWLAYEGGPGFRYLIESFPVTLMEAGLSAADVRTILVDNPEMALSTQPMG